MIFRGSADGKFVTLAQRRELKRSYDNRRNTGARLPALA